MVALLDALRPLLSFLVTLLPAEKREGDSAVVRDEVEIFGRLFFVDRFLRILASIPTASVSSFLPLFCFFFVFRYSTLAILRSYFILTAHLVDLVPFCAPICSLGLLVLFWLIWGDFLLSMTISYCLVSRCMSFLCLCDICIFIACSMPLPFVYFSLFVPHGLTLAFCDITKELPNILQKILRNFCKNNLYDNFSPFSRQLKICL